MKIARDTWLGIALLLILVLATLLAALQQSGETSLPPLTSLSAQPDGARALRLWLKYLGYQVGGEGQSSFEIPEETAVVLILEPLTSVLDEEWRTIDSFVQRGGLLILAGHGSGTQLSAQHFDSHITWNPERIPSASLQSPLLHSPPIEMLVNVSTSYYLETDRTDAVTLLASANLPITITFPQGSGRVVLSSAVFPFTNAGLKVQGNPNYVLNFFPGSDPKGTVWFDEWHHGLRVEERVVLGTESWLRYTPAGQSLIYFAVVVFLYLVLRGKRFGRPIPLPQTRRRRTPLEYITAMANLSRRAGHRTPTLRRYEHWLKRNLGKRYHIDPKLEDEVYVERLFQFDPDLNREELDHLLTRLKDRNVTETEFVQLGAQAARWTNAK